MKVSQAVDFHLQYHRANSKKNTIKTCDFVLSRFTAQFSKRDLASISQEEILAFLLSLTQNNQQATTRNRYSVLSSFYNFTINNALLHLTLHNNTYSSALPIGIRDDLDDFTCGQTCGEFLGSVTRCDPQT